MFYSFFFFNDTATTEIYTLSLHDALPISYKSLQFRTDAVIFWQAKHDNPGDYNDGSSTPNEGITTLHSIGTTVGIDRKSTRLNSSHSQISYAVFCLKKKKKWIFRSLTGQR